MLATQNVIISECVSRIVFGVAHGSQAADLASF